MNQYNNFLSVLKETDEKKDPKKTHHIRNSAIAGISGAALGAGYKSYKVRGAVEEYQMWKKLFKEAEIYAKTECGESGEKHWERFKTDPIYKQWKKKALFSILKTGAIAGAIGVLIYGFSQFLREERNQYKKDSAQRMIIAKRSK